MVGFALYPACTPALRTSPRLRLNRTGVCCIYVTWHITMSSSCYKSCDFRDRETGYNCIRSSLQPIDSTSSSRVLLSPSYSIQGLVEVFSVKHYDAIELSGHGSIPVKPLEQHVACAPASTETANRSRHPRRTFKRSQHDHGIDRTPAHHFHPGDWICEGASGSSAAA